jgi:hypothetical protein
MVMEPDLPSTFHSSLLYLPKNRIPGRETSAPLAKNPHRNGQQADKNMKAADGREDFKRTLLGDPVCRVISFTTIDGRYRKTATYH